MQKLNREIGSSFYELHESDHEFQILKQDVVTLDLNFTYYYSGRNAILALLKNITNGQTINTIWLPEYYCDTVVNLVSSNFNNIKYYAINPFEFDEEIDVTTFATHNDVVILNNYWGLSVFSYPNKNRPIIIEDYSHAWLSQQSLNSNADYCICSLRKTYPIPLGAVTWTPNSNKKINFYEYTIDKSVLKALDTFSKSMSLKRLFIKNTKEYVKEDYLYLLDDGEALLNISNNYIKPPDIFVDLVKKYMCLNPNPIKDKHLKYIFKHLNETPYFKIIKREGVTPFGLLLLFNDLNLFHSFKKHMISNHIYPAHLWPHNDLQSSWKYVFNIHVDFRYDIDDMTYVCETINTWIENIS